MLVLFIIFLFFVIAFTYEFIEEHVSTPEDRRHTLKTMLSIIVRALIVIIILSVIITVSGSASSVMSWILSDGNETTIIFAPLIISLLDILILSILDECNLSGANVEFEIKFSIRIYVYLLLSLIFLITSCFISTTYESETDWKTVYTNETDANVEISFQTSILEDMLFNHGDLHYAETINPESELNNKTYVLNKSRYGTLNVKKESATETRKIRFDKNNLIGELTKQSKITKIEYRNITSMRRTLFGFEGKPQQISKLAGEVRITIDDNPQRQELKDLLDN